ncbi:MAG: helix-turn-helix transcriptional regulator [Bacteroidota bacterium]
MKEKDNIQKKFGKHLKKLRLERGITGAELARRSFIDKPHITRLEKGETNPTLYTLIKLSQALEISLQELFQEFKL